MVADTLLGIEMLRAQCRLFMIGSSLFAIGTVPGFAMLCGADAARSPCPALYRNDRREPPNRGAAEKLVRPSGRRRIR